MAAPKLSDREMLHRLIDSGRLGREEKQEVERLLGELDSGSIAQLARPKRVWVERLFYEHRLGEPRPNDLVLSNKAKAKANAKELIAAFDAMPRPKKPPGKG